MHVYIVINQKPFKIIKKTVADENTTTPNAFPCDNFKRSSCIRFKSSAVVVQYSKLNNNIKKKNENWKYRRQKNR